MNSIFSPYTKKEAIELYSRYFGISKAEARRNIEAEALYIYGKSFPNDYFARRLAEIENGLKDQAKKSFYED